MARNRLAIFVAIILTFFCSDAFAQLDTEPPVILDFSIAPTVFDTTIADAVLNYCVTAADIGTGLGGNLLSNSVTATAPGIGQLFTTNFAFSSGAAQDTQCRTVTVPRFSLLGTFFIQVTVRDRFGTAETYRHPTIGVPTDPNLCDVGPCELQNLASSELPDSDTDGTPDDLDNCPNDANADQSDTDLDLIGDACDPFPNNRDSEQAQCDQDLAQTSTDLVTCDQGLGQCQTDLGATQTDLGVCQIELSEKETAPTLALATINAMRSCVSHYKKENGVRCWDGEDNDCDGLIDDDDPDCGSKPKK